MMIITDEIRKKEQEVRRAEDILYDDYGKSSIDFYLVKAKELDALIKKQEVEG